MENSIKMNTKSKILAVGAHPDDVELGCAGTIIKHIEEGDEVFVVVMTNGENGEHTTDRKECLKSLKFLGVKKSNIYFGNFSDGALPDTKYAVGFVEEIINKYGIEKVYTHAPDDRHQDHRNCSRVVSSAARKVPEIFLFEGPSTNVTFEPHYFVELSDDNIKRKLKALRHYKSQINKSINLEWVESLAKVYVTKTWARNTEAFAINHMLKRSKND